MVIPVTDERVPHVPSVRDSFVCERLPRSRVVQEVSHFIDWRNVQK